MKDRRGLAATVGSLMVIAALGTGSATAGGESPPSVNVAGPNQRYTLLESGGHRFSWNVTQGSYKFQEGETIQVSGDHTGLRSGYLQGRYESLSGSHETTVGPGWTTCLRVEAMDTNEGTSRELTCVAAPVDDANLSKTGGWRTTVRSGSFHKTISSTSKRGQSIELQDAVFTHGAVVVTKCPGCGKVRVSVDGMEILTASLDASFVKKKHLLKFDLDDNTEPPARSLIVKVVSDGKPVKIDGIAPLNWSITGKL